MRKGLSLGNGLFDIVESYVIFNSPSKFLTNIKNRKRKQNIVFVHKLIRKLWLNEIPTKGNTCFNFFFSLLKCGKGLIFKIDSLLIHWLK